MARVKADNTGVVEALKMFLTTIKMYDEAMLSVQTSLEAGIQAADAATRQEAQQVLDLIEGNKIGAAHPRAEAAVKRLDPEGKIPTGHF